MVHCAWNHSLQIPDLKSHHSLHNCGEANQRHQNLEEVSKLLPAYKPVDQGEANHADDDDDRHVYDQYKHADPQMVLECYFGEVTPSIYRSLEGA